MAWQRGHGMALVWGEQRSSSGGPGSEVPMGFAVGLPTAWAGGSCNPPNHYRWVQHLCPRLSHLCPALQPEVCTQHTEFSIHYSEGGEVVALPLREV